MPTYNPRLLQGEQLQALDTETLVWEWIIKSDESFDYTEDIITYYLRKCRFRDMLTHHSVLF